MAEMDSKIMPKKTNSLYGAKFIVSALEAERSDAEGMIEYRKNDLASELGREINKNVAWTEEVDKFLNGTTYSLEIVAMTRQQFDETIKAAQSFGYKKGVTDALYERNNNDQL